MSLSISLDNNYIECTRKAQTVGGTLIFVNYMSTLVSINVSDQRIECGTIIHLNNVNSSLSVSSDKTFNHHLHIF